MCQNAWKQSDNLSSFRLALEERSFFLAKGDRRGFVILDHMGKVYSLSRFSGIRKKDLEGRLGQSDQLPSVAETQQKIRKTFNAEILARISDLKQEHKKELLPQKEKQALLVYIQKAERKELLDQQCVKRSFIAKKGKDRYRRGVRGFFDKVTGRERKVKLVNRKETKRIKKQQKESRQMMIFRQNRDRRALQEEMLTMRGSQRKEREQLAKRIYEFRQVQILEREQTSQQEFLRANRGKDKLENVERFHSGKRKSRIRTID